MANDLPDELRHRLLLLAREVMLERYPQSHAVTLACDLLAAGVEGHATVEVASLPEGATWSDAADHVHAMLSEHGVQVPKADAGEARYTVLRDAFRDGILTAGDFEGAFYVRLPEWSAQHPLDRTLALLYDERDHLTDERQRANVEERMRQAIRDHVGT